VAKVWCCLEMGAPTGALEPDAEVGGAPPTAEAGGASSARGAPGSQCVVAEDGCERAVARVPSALRVEAVTTSSEERDLRLLRDALKDLPDVLHRADDEVGPCDSGCGGMAAGRTPPAYRPLATFSPLFVLSARPLAVVVMPTVAPPKSSRPLGARSALAADVENEEVVQSAADDGDYVPFENYQPLLRWRIGGHLGGSCTSPPRVGYAAVLLLPTGQGGRCRPLDAHFGIPSAAVPLRRLRGPLPPPILCAIRLRLVNGV